MKEYTIELQCSIRLRAELTPGKKADIWSIPSTPSVPEKLVIESVQNIMLEGASLIDLLSSELLEAIAADPGVRTRVREELRHAG